MEKETKGVGKLLEIKARAALNIPLRGPEDAQRPMLSRRFCGELRNAAIYVAGSGFASLQGREQVFWKSLRP